MSHVTRIYITGPSGAGKTTTGRLLAAHLGWGFLDTDEMIAEEAGQSVPSLFATQGEDAFRDRESKALVRLSSMELMVIATGGGLVEREANRLRMRSTGWLATLTVDPAVAIERLGLDGLATRPLLMAEDPAQRLRALMARRATAYGDADDVVDTSRLTPEQGTARLIGGLVAAGRLPAMGAPVGLRRHIRSSLGRHLIIVADGALGDLPDRVKTLASAARVFVVSDELVARLYGDSLLSRLRSAGFDVKMRTVPAGEASKTRERWASLTDWLADAHAERGDVLLALGGGMITDLTGFVAATYRRGMRLVLVPASLLAMVDAAIGGKVAVNLPAGKNLLGAFYPAELVVIDPNMLLTLDERLIAEGMAEVIKIAAVKDANFFAELEADPTPSGHVIATAVDLKAEIVERDERETGERLLLNFGHTIGHAIETATGYDTWLHGEAVAAGMCAELLLGVRAGITPVAVAERVQALIRRTGLPMDFRGHAPPVAGMLAAMRHDKKIAAGEVRWALLDEIGRGRVTTGIVEADVRAVLRELGAIDVEPPSRASDQG
ncbi:MAG TPA: 3-dehydroquinate synthase [Ktedonobacterales bacterium]